MKKALLLECFLLVRAYGNQTLEMLDNFEFDGSFNCFYGISCAPII